MANTRFKSPIGRRDEGADVEIDEQALVLPCADVPESLFNHSNALLESVEVARSQSLSMAEDVYYPLDEASLQPLFRGGISTCGCKVGGLAYGRANQRRSVEGLSAGHSRYAHSPGLVCLRRKTWP